MGNVNDSGYRSGYFANCYRRESRLRKPHRASMLLGFASGEVGLLLRIRRQADSEEADRKPWLSRVDRRLVYSGMRCCADGMRGPIGLSWSIRESAPREYGVVLGSRWSRFEFNLLLGTTPVARAKPGLQTEPKHGFFLSFELRQRCPSTSSQNAVAK